MRAFFDVDTQNDFMGKNGALYVNGAEDIHNLLKELTKYAMNNGIPIVGSVDAHSRDDPELKVFGPHCLKDTYGGLKIPETYHVRTLRIPNKRIDNLAKLAECLRTQKYRALYLEKQTTDVFSNPNTEELLRNLGADEFVVYGVATDFCVRDAVLGLLKRGYNVSIVGDATRAVNLTPIDGQASLELMVASGAKLLKASEVLTG